MRSHDAGERAAFHWLRRAGNSEPGNHPGIAGRPPPGRRAGIDAATIADLRRHPRFPDALRAIAALGVELYQGNRLLNAVFNDRGRLFLGMFALYLHFTRRAEDPGSGLTAARLQSLFVETGLGGAGRTKALIALMRWGGYLEEAPASPDRRIKALQPTQKMLAMHRERWRRVLGAAGLVRPEAAEGYARFDEPGFLRAYTIALASEVVGGFRILEQGPELKLLADRNAGFTIMFSVALAAPPGDGMPPTGIIPVSASALARRFHVSRSHVTTLLRDAQAAGLLKRSGTLDMQIRFLPRLIESFEKVFGSILLWHAASARYALDEIDSTRGGSDETA